jgi:uncharacterized membrane protein
MTRVMTLLSHAWAGFALEARLQGGWMGWNLGLALLPVVAFALLFHHRDRRGAGWWSLAVGAALFLPNTPYLATDIVHLVPDFQAAPSPAAAWAGVIPLFAALVTIGLVGYLYCLRLLRRDLRHHGVSRRRRITVELAVHVACSVGIVLGRVNRLNSWDVADPRVLVSALTSVSLRPTVLVALTFVVLVSATLVIDRVVSTLFVLRARH